MENLTILVEDKETKNGVELFIENYKDQIAQFLLNVLRGETGSADPAIIKDADGVYSIYRTAPDKGWVLSDFEAPEGVPLHSRQYTSVPSGSKYVTFDGDKMSLYLKQPEGQPDLKVGKFSNLNHAFTALDSPEVNKAIELSLEHLDTIRKAAKKALDKVERKTKLKQLVSPHNTQHTEVENESTN